ncbi:hypothetical protein AC579_1062 [Pseudocercospora musae]|uniref:Uncharacterized protein n=1 Tax=Pseudocercospora musae TaxID=113226 RepID=A0A139HZ54_9PEZI|nr:hypothetical protein AC579_1062 [Pseudocercospora musae]
MEVEFGFRAALLLAYNAVDLPEVNAVIDIVMRGGFSVSGVRLKTEPFETSSNSNRAKVTSISIFQKPSMFTSNSSIDLREPYIGTNFSTSPSRPPTRRSS